MRFDLSGKSGRRGVRGSVFLNGAAVRGLQVVLRAIADRRSHGSGFSAPVSSVAALARSVRGDASQVSTDDQGVFSFASVPFGRYRLEVRNHGLVIAGHEVALRRSQKPFVHHFEIRTGAVEFAVRSDGKATAGHVRLRMALRRDAKNRAPDGWHALPSSRETVQVGGQISISGLPIGAWIFEIRGADGGRHQGSVRVTGGTSRVTVDLGVGRIAPRSGR